MESAHTPTRRCLSGAICTATGTPEHEISENPVTADVLALVSMTIQQRPDAQAKLSQFMTAEDIEHCPPSDNDWLVAFNDHSLHETVIALLDEAIAASEPCEACSEPLTPESMHFVAVDDEPEQVLCDQCSLLQGVTRFSESPEPHDHRPDEHPLPAYSFTKGGFTWHS